MKACVIGCGNLGESFIKGLIKSNAIKPEELTVADPDQEKLEKIKKLNIKTTTDNSKAAKNSETIFIAVKPNLVKNVLENLDLSSEKLLISLAAGVSTKFLKKHTNARIIRVMPNICSSTTEMASAYTLGKKAKEKDKELIHNILNKMGTGTQINESLMDAVTGLSGSGPAYIFLIIEALRDVGKELGLSEEKSLELAAQTVKGSSELVLDSEKSLEELVDMVCSPKGTTIEGVKVMRDKKVQETLKKAVKAAAERSEELSR